MSCDIYVVARKFQNEPGVKLAADTALLNWRMNAVALSAQRNPPKVRKVAIVRRKLPVNFERGASWEVIIGQSAQDLDVLRHGIQPVQNQHV